jgi:hypothetical protein
MLSDDNCQKVRPPTYVVTLTDDRKHNNPRGHLPAIEATVLFWKFDEGVI